MNKTQQKIKKLLHNAESLLLSKQYVCVLDLFQQMGLVAPSAVELWRKGRVRALEEVIQGNLSRISDYMKAFRSWAKEKGLKPSRTEYVSKSTDRHPLQFSKSGDPTIEEHYCTHWISPLLSEKKQQQLVEKTSKAPELVVYDILKESHCTKCNKELFPGSFLYMDKQDPLCLNCANLGHLEYLPAGDALVSRRAKKYSSTYAVVVRFSRSRKRYERRGLLVEKEALAKSRSNSEQSSFALQN